MNQCWSVFGTAVYLVFALGLHRQKRADPPSGYDHIEAECRRRTFWNAYCLGNYLSTALGRPRSFCGEDIDQELPLCVEDDDMHTTYVNHRMHVGQSLISGPVVYFKCVAR